MRRCDTRIPNPWRLEGPSHPFPHQRSSLPPTGERVVDSPVFQQSWRRSGGSAKRPAATPRARAWSPLAPADAARSSAGRCIGLRATAIWRRSDISWRRGTWTQTRATASRSLPCSWPRGSAGSTSPNTWWSARVSTSRRCAGRWARIEPAVVCAALRLPSPALKATIALEPPPGQQLCVRLAALDRDRPASASRRRRRAAGPVCRLAQRARARF